MLPPWIAQHPQDRSHSQARTRNAAQRAAEDDVMSRRVWVPLAKRTVRVGYERNGLGLHRSILGKGWTVCAITSGYRGSSERLPYWKARRICDALCLIGDALHINWSMGPGELKHTLDNMELTGPLTELTYGRIKRRVSARKITADFLRKYRVFGAMS